VPQAGVEPAGLSPRDGVGCSDPEDDKVEPQTVYEMRTPDAREVADLLAVQQDLTYVWEACDLLLDLPTDDPGLRKLLTRALWSSALVAYARCFATGKRLGFNDDDVQRVAKGNKAVKFHRKMLDLRNEHIAHSVNPLEFIKIGIMVGSLSRDDEEGVTGLVTLFGADWKPHPTSIDSLSRLAEGLLGVVMDRAEEQTPALRETAQETGLETIKRWPELVFERGSIDPAAVRDL
jgi:hypothetical protein